jgi:hypothetical protein
VGWLQALADGLVAPQIIPVERKTALPPAAVFDETALLPVERISVMFAPHDLRLQNPRLMGTVQDEHT